MKNKDLPIAIIGGGPVGLAAAFTKLFQQRCEISYLFSVFISFVRLRL